MPAFIGRGFPSSVALDLATPLSSETAPSTPTASTSTKPVRVWHRRADRPLPSDASPNDISRAGIRDGKGKVTAPSSTNATPLRAQFSFRPAPKSRNAPTLPTARQVSARSSKSAKSARSTQSAQTARSRRSGWSGKSGRSARSIQSIKSRLSNRSNNRLKLPPLDLHHPLSKLAEALDLANITAPSAKERRATKAALALRQLILDPPQFELCAVALPSALTGVAPVGGADLVDRKGRRGGDLAPGASNALTAVGTKGKKSFVPRLREKDVSRLRTQLLKPTEAKMVIAHARSLPVAEKLSNNDRAVCLNCPEDEADNLIEEAHRIEGVRRKEEQRLDKHRFSTIKAPPSPPPRLPVLLSLFSGLTAVGAMPGTGIDASITMLGLFEPASAMSLHRPLAGALPSADTLRRGFDALINAESKVYMFQGPSHKNIHPPIDRMSVYTYWWGFELALPPPTMKYLSHAKSIATSVLNLLSVIVYAVPGGTRELAPFVGVLSRFIDNEWKQSLQVRWALLKSQDKGRGVVCGATWFIPAALVARPWDFGEETIRDRIVAEEEKKQLAKERIDPGAVVRITGPKGEHEEAVVIGVGKGVVKGQRTSPVIPWQGSQKVGYDKGKLPERGGEKEVLPGAPKRKPISLPAVPHPKPTPDPTEGQHPPGKGNGRGPMVHGPPSIALPNFTALGLVAASAPASPARTTPPTPARAKFGWRHKAFKARPSPSTKAQGTMEAVKVDDEEAGSDAVVSADYSESAPLESMPDIAATADEPSGSREHLGPDDKVLQGGTVLLPILAALPAEETSQDAIAAAVTGEAVPPTAISRTMRRIKGTMGRLRSSIPIPQTDSSSKVDPFPLLHDAHDKDTKEAASTGSTYGSAHSQVESSEKRRSILHWSGPSTGPQSVREKKCASTVLSTS